jgi:hypothetical protein
MGVSCSPQRFERHRSGALTLNICPAATLILLRDTADGPEVFMQRAPGAVFLGGADVFPGGALEASDADRSRQLQHALIMPESDRVAGVGHRRARGANHCGPQRAGL